MRMRERGIGNLPFIAVLVLFVVAVALWFVAKGEADSWKERAQSAEKVRKEADDRAVDLQTAYNSLVDVFGVEAADLAAKNQVAPKPEEIQQKVRDYLWERVGQMKQRGEAILKTRVYQVQQAKNVIITAEGEQAKVQLYGVPLSQDTITVRGMLDGLPDILAFAAQVMMDNNAKFEDEFGRYETWKKDMESQFTRAEQSYRTDVSDKQRQAETWKTELDDTKTQLETAINKIDVDATQHSQELQVKDKEIRVLQRDLEAATNRWINEKIRKELVLKEDPKDGTIIAASETRGTVFLDLGRRQRLPRGTKFKVWRPGKGNVREDVAVIRVITVGESSSEARIVEQLDPRVPVTRGMNVSNPFFDPSRELKAFIWGDLTRYSTDLAARRLSAAGVKMVKKLDDTVNIIILGEPPVAVEEEMPEDEAEIAAAERRKAMDRERRLEEIMRIATSIQALVVTEDALSTFIDY